MKRKRVTLERLLKGEQNIVAKELLAIAGKKEDQLTQVARLFVMNTVNRFLKGAEAEKAGRELGESLIDLFCLQLFSLFLEGNDQGFKELCNAGKRFSKNVIEDREVVRILNCAETGKRWYVEDLAKEIGYLGNHEVLRRKAKVLGVSFQRGRKRLYSQLVTIGDKIPTAAVA